MNKQVLFPIIFLLVVVAFLAGTKLQNLPGSQKPTPSEQPPSPQQSKSAVLGASDMADLAKGGVVLGAADSKVTVVEFSDPSCPFCAAAAGVDIVVDKDENGKDVKIISDYLQKRDPSWQAPGPNLEKLAREGKIQLVFRYFPGHGSGERAIMSAWCAQEQKEGVFWEFLEQLFINHNELENDNTFWQIAKKLNLDDGKIKSCVDSGKYKERISKDVEAARQAASQIEGADGFGTPTFFVDGQMLIGAQSFTAFENIINPELR